MICNLLNVKAAISRFTEAVKQVIVKLDAGECDKAMAPLLASIYSQTLVIRDMGKESLKKHVPELDSTFGRVVDLVVKSSHGTSDSDNYASAVAVLSSLSVFSEMPELEHLPALSHGLMLLSLLDALGSLKAIPSEPDALTSAKLLQKIKALPLPLSPWLCEHLPSDVASAMTEQVKSFKNGDPPQSLLARVKAAVAPALQAIEEILTNTLGMHPIKALNFEDMSCLEKYCGCKVTIDLSPIKETLKKMGCTTAVKRTEFLELFAKCVQQWAAMIHQRRQITQREALKISDTSIKQLLGIKASMHALSIFEKSTNLDVLFSLEKDAYSLGQFDNFAEAGILTRELQRQAGAFQSKMVEEWVSDADELAKLVTSWCPECDPFKALDEAAEAQAMRKALFENPRYEQLPDACNHLDDMISCFVALNKVELVVGYETLRNLEKCHAMASQTVLVTYVTYALMVDIPKKPTPEMRAADAQALKAELMSRDDIEKLPAQFKNYINAIIKNTTAGNEVAADEDAADAS